MNFLQDIDKTWTLFLDRDGVINKKIENGYVLNIEMFKFLNGVLEGLSLLAKIFNKIIIVTNQRGIGKGLMSEKDLNKIHDYMLKEITSNGGRIDAIFYCPHDYEKQKCNCRKPNIGMALNAKKLFPEINFKKSIVIGDSLIDMEFAKNIGAIGIYVGNKIYSEQISFRNLKNFAEYVFTYNK